jgi:hypothetical protein
MVDQCWQAPADSDAVYTQDGRDAVCANPAYNQHTALLCVTIVCECILGTSYLDTDDDLPCTRFPETP